MVDDGSRNGFFGAALVILFFGEAVLLGFESFS